MWIWGYLVWGLVLIALCCGIVAGLLWLHVHVFNYLGYQKSLIVDGAQMAAIFGGASWHARRERYRG